MSTSNRLTIFDPFKSRLRIIAEELRNDLRNTSRRDSVAINWRALEDLYTNEEDQDKILDQAIDIVRDTERYTDDNEHLRDRIEIHLSDILDIELPSPKATPSDSSASSASQNSDARSSPTGAGGLSEDARSSLQVSQGAAASMGWEEETHGTSAAPGTSEDSVLDSNGRAAESE